MKGDFTRNTFDPFNHFTRVLMQQGRVQVDSDWNEQTSIVLHFLRTLARDLIGPFGGPKDILGEDDIVIKKTSGFEIITEASDIDNFAELSDEEKEKLEKLLSSSKIPILISKGHYYVDGYLCTNDDFILFNNQPDYPVPDDEKLDDGDYLVYLDVWERHLTWQQYPNMREIALGGPDTASRAKLLCQVKVDDEPPNGVSMACPGDFETWEKWVEKWQPKNRGMLKAQARKPQVKEDDPCDISPESQYRGPENQLYRVEIHNPGEAGEATFKWSRDNGSVIYAIRSLQGETAVVYDLGADDRSRLQPGQWVEITDDDMAKRGETGPLLQVEDVDPVENLVILLVPEGQEIPVYDEDETDEDESKHPLLRRWDTLPNAESPEITIEEGSGESDWFDIEDGIQIQFQKSDIPDSPHIYRAGDYWLIPARTATGDILWPKVRDAEGALMPEAKRPHGIDHHYAPLAIISVDAGHIGLDPDNDCRCTFGNLCVAQGQGFSIRPGIRPVPVSKAGNEKQPAASKDAGKTTKPPAKKPRSPSPKKPG